MAELERTLWEELRESNENRIEKLENQADPERPGSMENTFDALRILTFVEQIALHVGCFDDASLDFETKRADHLEKMEQMFAEIDATVAARARQGPNRQQRRHPGPSGIVR